MPKRLRLATGIYRDAHGIAVIYHANGAPVETRFELGRPLEGLIRWRRQQLRTAEAKAPRDPRGSLARDAVRYLKRLKGLPGYKSEKSHLRAWLLWFGGATPRWKVTAEQCDLAIADWRTRGYSARTIRHRVRVLEALFHRLDGATAPTPLDEVLVPAKPKPRPVSVADGRIAAVALELRKHEIAGTLRDAKTRARFLVLATTGRRPTEVIRAQREDVDFERRLWMTRTAKGGLHTVLPLNTEQLAAWQLFASAGAWGAYDGRSFVRTVQRCGWPRGVRVYNLRHSTAHALRLRGGDPKDVQDQLGHTSIETGAFYFESVPERQAAVSASLDGRLGTPAFFPSAPRAPKGRRPGYHDRVTTIGPRRDSKPRDFTGKARTG